MEIIAYRTPYVSNACDAYRELCGRMKNGTPISSVDYPATSIKANSLIMRTIKDKAGNVTHEIQAARIPIRKCMRFGWLKYTGETIAWRLFKPRVDDEVIGCIHLDHVAAIAYCPFCGEKLPEVENETD